jgi:hypothetical protein
VTAQLALLAVELIGLFLAFVLALFLPAGTLAWPAGLAPLRMRSTQVAARRYRSATSAP